MAGRISFHNLGHCLLDQGLETGEPVTVRRPKVVREIHANHHTGWRGVDAHVVRDLRMVNKIEEREGKTRT